MSPSYYFINHTRGEFCYFDENNRIIEELIIVINKNEGWTIDDDIKVDSEISEYLTNSLNYKNLNYDPDPEFIS